MEETKLGIYIHIPFCVQKCRYCDFLSAPADEAVREAYVEALCREISAFEDAGTCRAVSVFFGGGTPSLLRADQIAQILDTVAGRFSFAREAGLPEITLECNPGTTTRQSLQDLKKAGINRLSIGAQSADDRQLKKLGRIHSWGQFLAQYTSAREAGFNNINIDLISALPGQSTAEWADTLEQAAALAPEHISAYSLIIEEGTPFYALYHAEDERRAAGQEIPEESRMLPTEEEERKMYTLTSEILEMAGMKRYEISNYAVPGRESIHNTGYWLRRDYAGFGLGASSLLKGGTVRSKNTQRLETYLADPGIKEETTELSLREQMEESVFLGLRMDRGVDTEAFDRQFRPLCGKSFAQLYHDTVERLRGQELVELKNGYLRLTEQGIHISNYVMSSFLL